MAINFPDSPSDNDIYTVNGKRWIYSSGKWSIYGSTAPDATASDTEPSGVGDGHIWYRSDQSQTLIRYDNTWVEVGSAGGFDNASTNFPTSLDSATGFAAVEALQAKVGVDSSAVTTSIDYRLNTLSYQYVQTVYFTSNGTFTKATYPWLRAVRVKCQGAGGGGGNRATSGDCAAGGGGGALVESFITNIAGLAASETVTVGAGGTGKSAGSQGEGTAGSDSSFGTLVVAPGGGGTGGNATLGGVGGSTGGSTGDVVFSGSAGAPGSGLGDFGGGNGGSSPLGGGGRGSRAGGGAGSAGTVYGGGGGGSSVDNDGGDGAGGIVIVELYA